jgi:serine/threonine protein kinase
MHFPAGNKRPSSGLRTTGQESCTATLSRGEIVPGTRLQIVGPVERGAVGKVFRAEHLDLERPVAIKLLRESDGTDTAECLRQEAARITRIDSPYVVTVLDYGVLPDGRTFYVMPWLGPSTLADVIAQGPLPAQQTIGLLRMACKGLAATHAAGLTHRDVKPENFVVVEHGGRLRLVVVDFGMACPSGSVPEVHGGTPTYMSPEQVVGLPVDERTDIYGLGCVAYELLTGRAPFVGPTLVSLLRQHADCEPDPPSLRGADRLPAGLETIVLRCLEKEPNDRYASMAELEAALCEVQASAGLHSPWDDLCPPDVDDERRSAIARALYDSWSPPARRTRTVIALVAAALVLVAAPLFPLDGSASAADPLPAAAPEPINALHRPEPVQDEESDRGCGEKDASVELSCVGAVAIPGRD